MAILHAGHLDRTKWWPNWEGGACITWRAITQIDYPTLTGQLGEQPYIPAYSPPPFTWCALQTRWCTDAASLRRKDCASHEHLPRQLLPPLKEGEDHSDARFFSGCFQQIWSLFRPPWHLLSVVSLLLWVAAGIYIGSEHDTWFPITLNGPTNHPESWLEQQRAKTLRQPLRPGPPIWQPGKVGPLYLLIISTTLSPAQFLFMLPYLPHFNSMFCEWFVLITESVVDLLISRKHLLRVSANHFFIGRTF